MTGNKYLFEELSAISFLSSQSPATLVNRVNNERIGQNSY